jgi:hypothetical protein
MDRAFSIEKSISWVNLSDLIIVEHNLKESWNYLKRP